MSGKVGRPEKKKDEKEMDEIIELKLEELGGNFKKLTYNNVYLLSKKLYKEKISRKNGEGIYSKYSRYDWESGIGREKIDSKKNPKTIDIIENDFGTKTIDIVTIINKYSKNANELTKRLLPIILRDRRKIVELESKIEKIEIEYKDKIKTLKQKNENLENGVINLFYSSQSSKNSLINLMNIGKSGDKIVKENLEKMFGEDMSSLIPPESTKITNYKVTNDKVIEIKNTDSKKVNKIKNNWEW